MQVETFEQTEQTTDADGNVSMECDVEALALIESLGLDGQRRLATRHDDSDVVTRCPYRMMTQIEERVYRILCPQSQKLDEYDAGPIPLRVLQVAAHAQGLFKELRVWSANSPLIKDPVLVGMKKISKEDWRGDSAFILARWGDVLAPFEELSVRAADSTRERYKAVAGKILRQAQNFLGSIDSVPDSAIVLADEPVAYHLD